MDNSEDRGATAAPNGVSLGPLPGFIGYALRRAQLVIFDDFIRTLETVDLRPAYFSALIIIDENPGLNQSEVSAALGVQRTNFVTMVDHLEKRNLIERRPSKKDRRSYALHLTKEGRALLGKARQLQAAHEEHFARKLGPGGREQLLPLLWKLVE
ncbi:MarR family winged helix-turn-helix transcriptional regulator [Chelativorans alearense]|uniref:MarR family winged helix-turn-helix transcriptional regulator n=1 Tax=Chelativorans alearense TaxID=2681495 RepID=UPI0013D665D1|nr:MarR family transcriptional regulator [Chelativorans alearense]